MSVCQWLRRGVSGLGFEQSLAGGGCLRLCVCQSGGDLSEASRCTGVCGQCVDL